MVAWEKIIPRGESLRNLQKIVGKNINHSLYFYALDKKNKRLKLLSSVDYDKSGKVIYSYTNNFDTTEWEDIAPNSNGQAFYDSVMTIYENKQNNYTN